MIPGEQARLRASQWCYEGIWGLVTQWLRVPRQPPRIRGGRDHAQRSFRPDAGFLRYLKFYFWLGLFAIDAVLTILWLVLLVSIPWLGILIAPLAWALIVVPDIVVYVALHLRYDTTWYVLSERTLRIRRGVWRIDEVTITYQNIQNLSIRQGPLQRYFGIADVVIKTAGGGGTSSQHGEVAGGMGHHGLIEGVGNAAEIRDLILAAWRAHQSAGLGDERSQPASGSTTATASHGAALMGAKHIELLTEIRDLAVAMGEHHAAAQARRASE